MTTGWAFKPIGPAQLKKGIEALLFGAVLLDKFV